jgi:hypothetical protein
MTNSQRLADALGIVGTIAEYAVWTTPGSPSFALQRRDRIDQRQGVPGQVKGRPDLVQCGACRAGKSG